MKTTGRNLLTMAEEPFLIEPLREKALRFSLRTFSSKSQNQRLCSERLLPLAPWSLLVPCTPSARQPFSVQRTWGETRFLSPIQVHLREEAGIGFLIKNSPTPFLSLLSNTVLQKIFTEAHSQEEGARAFVLHVQVSRYGGSGGTFSRPSPALPAEDNGSGRTPVRLQCFLTFYIYELPYLLLLVVIKYFQLHGQWF